jgi:exoribonuclease-2
VEDDVVTVTRRKRGAPLDKIVAELMIFANSTWGKMMHDRRARHLPQPGQGVGGWNAKMQVRMLTHAAPHRAGRGPVRMEHLAAAPLHRPGQPVADPGLRRQGVMAPLVAHFKHKDAELFAIVSQFDAAYAAYADHQSNMERYWCLRWLGQENARQVDAVVLRTRCCAWSISR